MTERELIETLTDIRSSIKYKMYSYADSQIKTLIQSYSQPNGEDRVVSENEPQKKSCRNCKFSYCNMTDEPCKSCDLIDRPNWQLD